MRRVDRHHGAAGFRVQGLISQSEMLTIPCTSDTEETL